MRSLYLYLHFKGSYLSIFFTIICILYSYLILLICLHYALQTLIDLIKENGFTLKKKTRSKLYPAETITHASFVNDQAFLENTPANAKSQLDCQEQIIGDICLQINSIKKSTCVLNEKEPSPL